MPTIKLKPQSPEFDENKPKVEKHECDMPNCDDIGEYKAPKHRGLNEYYHFCIEHVREYNKAWNQFKKEEVATFQNSMGGDSTGPLIIGSDD